MAKVFERLAVVCGTAMVLAGIAWLGWTAFPAAFRANFVPQQVPELPEIISGSMAWQAAATTVGLDLISGPWTRFAPALLGVLILLAARGGPGGSFRDPRRSTSASEWKPSGSPARARREARRFLKQGCPGDAAECLLASGLPEEAASLWVDRAEWAFAAAVYRDHGHLREAADCFERARDFKAAGELYAECGEASQAGACFTSAGMHSRAGEMFSEAGDFEQAGAHFREAGFFREAARAFARSSAWRDAAECIEEVLRDRQHAEPRGFGAGPEVEKLSAVAGEFHVRSGSPERAIVHFERAGNLDRAAEIACELGESGRAAQLFAEAGDPLRAAGVLESSGDADSAGRVRAHFHRDQGRLEEAAQAFEALGDSFEAAEVHRERGDFARAGERFLGAGDPARAAEMYERAGDLAKAVPAWERAGRYAEAAGCAARLGEKEEEARLRVRAGDFLAAGELYEQVGRPDEAIRLLQQVDRRTPEFARAAGRLAEIMRGRGETAVAIATLETVLGVGGGSPSRQDLPLAYELARAYEAHGEVPNATALYEKIRALDYHYRDAAERLQRIVRRGTGESSRRYVIHSEVGRGGMGVVYRAQDGLLDRSVAYKVLSEELTENPRALKNFLSEAKAAAKLNHPNIVTVHDAGEQDGRSFIAMEFVDGPTLRGVLVERGPLAIAEWVPLLLECCQALAYAHDHGVVHRDIKTANLMWTGDRRLKIMDFGLARLRDRLGDRPCSVSGTPYYMSPEQVLGRVVDLRTDLYSMGVTLFELATGRLPFDGGNIPYQHVHADPPDPREETPALPACLADVVNRCLRKNPADRYGSAQQILDELEEPLRGLRALAPDSG